MTIDPRLQRIVAAQPYPLLFATISGAHLYGFPSPDSDFDLRGAHVLPLEKVVGLEVREETVQDSRVSQIVNDPNDGAREQCREHLRAGRDFAFNATNITRQMRGRWIDLFADYSARVEVVYLEPPLRTILTQNQRRAKAVPETVIERLLEKLEPPTITECHALTIIESSTP